MKREMTMREIQLRMGLSVIAYDSLTQLEKLAHSDQREAAAGLADRIVALLQQRHIDFGLGNTAPVAHLYIEAEPAQPAAITPAQIDEADAYLEEHAHDMIRQAAMEKAAAEPAQPAQTDYAALIETAEKGVTDEVGTKV